VLRMRAPCLRRRHARRADWPSPTFIAALVRRLSDATVISFPSRPAPMLLVCKTARSGLVREQSTPPGNRRHDDNLQIRSNVRHEIDDHPASGFVAQTHYASFVATRASWTPVDDLEVGVRAPTLRLCCSGTSWCDGAYHVPNGAARIAGAHQRFADEDNLGAPRVILRDIRRAGHT
jgi:hypothetical protein